MDDANASPTPVAGQAEFSRRPRLARPGLVPGFDIPKALSRESGRPFLEFHDC